MNKILIFMIISSNVFALMNPTPLPLLAFSIPDLSHNKIEKFNNLKLTCFTTDMKNNQNGKIVKLPQIEMEKRHYIIKITEKGKNITDVSGNVFKFKNMSGDGNYIYKSINDNAFLLSQKLYDYNNNRHYYKSGIISDKQPMIVHIGICFEIKN